MNQIVILCGAERGGEIEKYKKRLPKCHIYAIEPEKSNFKFLHQKWGNDPKVILINKAVWIEDGTKTLYITKSAASHSLYQKTYLAVERRQDTATIDLAKFLEQFETVHLLRMNMEGAEYEVLKHCFEKGALDKVVELNVELHVRKMREFATIHDEVKAKLDEWGKTHIFKELK